MYRDIKVENLRLIPNVESFAKSLVQLVLICYFYNAREYLLRL